MGRKSRLFAHSLSSLDSRFAEVETEIAESLRPSPQIFPFWGDYGRRRVRSRLPPGGIRFCALIRFRAKTSQIVNWMILRVLFCLSFMNWKFRAQGLLHLQNAGAASAMIE